MAGEEIDKALKEIHAYPRQYERRQYLIMHGGIDEKRR